MFSQILKLILRIEFERIVRETRAAYRSKRGEAPGGGIDGLSARFGTVRSSALLPGSSGANKTAENALQNH